MKEKQWEATAATLSKTHAGYWGSPSPEDDPDVARPTEEQLRRALVELDNLLRYAPAQIQQRYKDLDETVLRSAANLVQVQLDQGSLEWSGTDLVQAAAAQVRGLDQHLFQHRSIRGKPNDITTDFFCPTTEVHVIPRPQAKPPAPTQVGTTVDCH